ncbi:hypothetical protein HII13_004486 [Brettanomyces bruxellensis]|nr:hypothetical protein HII13_004486 [Brettanomyces bruxellensis]
MAFLLNPFAVYSTLTLPEQFRPLEPTNNATGNSITRGSNNSSGTDGKNSPLSNITRDRNSSPTILQCTLAGAIGGVIGDTSVHSLDTVKTRQQGAFDVPKYKGTFNAYKTIWKEEGFFRGLYSGYSAAMLGSLPSSTAFFLFMKKKNHDHLPTGLEMLTGAAAGGLAGTLTTPFDVVKTRMQTQNGSSAGLLLTSNSLFKSLGIIYQKQGLKGSFSGVGPRFVWTSIQSSIMLLLYQTCVQILTSERLSFD